VLFADLNEDDFTHIHHPIDMVESYAGDALYHPEDHARHIYTVREGLVKLVQYLPDGTQRIVRLLKQGDVAGIEATLNKPYQHEAIVLDDALVCRIPVKVITDLSQSTPRLHKSLMEKWSSAVMEADQWLTELSTGTSKERVARLLLKLNEITPADRFTMPSREDIGSMLGITTETASRIIAEFKRNEFIKSCPNKKAIASVADLTGILNK
jgi:CRP-like cAMP-binding protein